MTESTPLYDILMSSVADPFPLNPNRIFGSGLEKTDPDPQKKSGSESSLKYAFESAKNAQNGTLRLKPWLRHFGKNYWLHMITLFCRPGPTKAGWADQAGRVRHRLAGKARKNLGPGRMLNSTFRTFMVVYFSQCVDQEHLRSIGNVYSVQYCLQASIIMDAASNIPIASFSTDAATMRIVQFAHIFSITAKVIKLFCIVLIPVSILAFKSFRKSFAEKKNRIVVNYLCYGISLCNSVTATHPP